MGGSDQDIVEFQEALQDYLGVRACFLASSGRTALFLLLKVLKAERPERPFILLPAYTCPALVKVILDVGLRPCPIDISPETFAFDMEELAAQLNEQVLAVIHVHPFGIPLAMDEVQSLAHGVGAVVIEDAAQAMGACWQGKQVGTTADFGLFSLGPGKPLSVGGGGVVCTDDETWAGLLAAAWRQLPAATALASTWALTRLLLIRLATNPRGWWLAARSGIQRWGEQPSSWGYRERALSPAQARIGRALLPHLDEINGVRRENGRHIAIKLQGSAVGQALDAAVEAEPIFLRLPFIADTAERRGQLYQRLWQANLGAGRLYRYALPDIFQELAAYSCPGAEQIAVRLLTLPTHHYLSQRDINHITDIF